MFEQAAEILVVNRDFFKLEGTSPFANIGKIACSLFYAVVNVLHDRSEEYFISLFGIFGEVTFLFAFDALIITVALVAGCEHYRAGVLIKASQQGDLMMLVPETFVV